MNYAAAPLIWFCFKASETLLGIETTQTAMLKPILLSFKASETLLGIETNRIWIDG